MVHYPKRKRSLASSERPPQVVFVLSSRPKHRCPHDINVGLAVKLSSETFATGQHNDIMDVSEYTEVRDGHTPGVRCRSGAISIHSKHDRFTRVRMALKPSPSRRIVVADSVCSSNVELLRTLSKPDRAISWSGWHFRTGSCTTSQFIDTSFGQIALRLLI